MMTRTFLAVGFLLVAHVYVANAQAVEADPNYYAFHPMSVMSVRSRLRPE